MVCMLQRKFQLICISWKSTLVWFVYLLNQIILKVRSVRRWQVVCFLGFQCLTSHMQGFESCLSPVDLDLVPSE